MEERHFGHIWFIPGENRGRYPFCHSIYVEGAGLLIDPGANSKRLIEIREHVGVKEIWLSHWHEDHFIHLDLFDDLPLRTSEADAVPLSDIERFMDAYGMENVEERNHWRDFFIDEMGFRPRRPMRFLRDGDIIALRDEQVEVIGSPGHTAGHLAFFFRNSGVLFMADHALTCFGPWYGDVDSSIEQTISSLRQLRDISAKIWLTSHETGVFEKDPGEAWDRYVCVIHEREEKLLNLLKTPCTLTYIVEAGIVYGKLRELNRFAQFGEKALIKKHLERLIKCGRVGLENGAYYSLRDKGGAG